jgi:thiamine pyrophosphokinase
MTTTTTTTTTTTAAPEKTIVEHERFVVDFLPDPSASASASATATAPTASTSDEMSQQSDDSLLLLNYHLPSFTRNLWARSRRRVCADGGANRLYDELPAMHPDEDAMEIRNAHLPDLIVGDLDSIRDDVRAFYVDRGCACVDLSHDQDSTDLHKAIAAMTREDEAEDAAHVGDGGLGGGLGLDSVRVPRRRNRNRRIFAVGALGGRLDHELSHMSALREFDVGPSPTRVVLLGRSSMATLIRGDGRTAIRPCVAVEGPTCGLVPMYGPAVVSTSGLKWDMDETTLAFGRFISTSNEMGEETVREGGGEIVVTTTAPLVWTTDITRCRR